MKTGMTVGDALLNALGVWVAGDVTSARGVTAVIVALDDAEVVGALGAVFVGTGELIGATVVGATLTIVDETGVFVSDGGATTNGVAHPTIALDKITTSK